MRKLGRGEVVRRGYMDTLETPADRQFREDVLNLIELLAALDRMPEEQPPNEAMRNVRAKARRWLGLPK